MANRVLVEMTRRERELDVVKTDYLVYAWAVVHGIDKKSYETKMKALNSMRQNMVDVVNHDAFDPSVRRRRMLEKKRELEKDRELLGKVSSMGK